MSAGDWQDRKYREVFDAVCDRLARRREIDAGFTPEELEGILRTAYIHEGNAWPGRGAVEELVHAATIAACEHVLAEWKKELAADESG